MEDPNDVNTKLQNLAKRNIHWSKDHFELMYDFSSANLTPETTEDNTDHETLARRPSCLDDPYAADCIDPTSTWNKHDSFLRAVAKKTQLYLIGHQEAEREVTVDKLIEQEGDKDKALLYVVSKLFGEAKVQVMVNTLLHRGAKPVELDSDRRTALHHAVSRNFEGITRRLLDSGAVPHSRDINKILPYKIALDHNNDDTAALLLAYMPNTLVRTIYSSNGNAPAEFSFQELLATEMQQTKMGVLDCMMEPGPSNRYRINYQILEADGAGRSPEDENFDESSKSPLHILARSGDKEVIYHDVVRLLLRRKWKLYARNRFSLNAVSFLISVFAISYALVIASKTPDPLVYVGALQISRAVFEVYFLVLILIQFVIEIIKMKRHRLDYWKDPVNWLDIVTICLMCSVVPLRVSRNHAQWAVFAVAYVTWVLRIFKYAPLFRSLGAFAQTLWTIITRDFVYFSIVFMVILLAFTGSFTLVMRWENNFNKYVETSSFWWVLFSGTRTLIEQQPVVETYVTPNGYGPFAIFLMVVYRFATMVVLLNILIAQLSDTYHNIQKDSQRGLELHRAWIIMRVERNSLIIGKGFRIKHYIDSELIEDPKEVLRKWENPPLQDTTKLIQNLSDRMDLQDLTLRSISNRLSHIQQQLGQAMAANDRTAERRPQAQPLPGTLHNAISGGSPSAAGTEEHVMPEVSSLTVAQEAAASADIGSNLSDNVSIVPVSANK